jgi:hypothetical protein
MSPWHEGAEVKLSLGLINLVPRHEDVWGNGNIAPPFSTSAVDGGELLGQDFRVSNHHDIKMRTENVHSCPRNTNSKELSSS